MKCVHLGSGMLPSLHCDILTSNPRSVLCVADLRGANGCHTSLHPQSSSVWCQDLFKHSLATYSPRKGRAAARARTTSAAATSADALSATKEQSNGSFSPLYDADETHVAQTQNKQKPSRRVRRRVDVIAETDSQGTGSSDSQSVNKQDNSGDNVGALGQDSGTGAKRGHRVTADAVQADHNNITEDSIQRLGVRARKQSTYKKGDSSAWESRWDVSKNDKEASPQAKAARTWIKTDDDYALMERSRGKTAGKLSGTRVPNPGGHPSAPEETQQQHTKPGSSRNSKEQMMLGTAAAVTAVGAVAATVSQSKQEQGGNDSKGGSMQTTSLTQLQYSTGKDDAAPIRVEISNDILQSDDQFIKQLEATASEAGDVKLTSVAQYLRDQLQQRGRYWPSQEEAMNTASTSSQHEQDVHVGGSTDDNGSQSADQRVYRSEVELVNDIVDTLLGVRLPPKAFYGARAEDLSKLAADVDQCKNQCRLWITACGKQLAKAFIAREPRLLVLSPDSLLLSLHAISTCMNLQDPAATLDWALRNSTLLQTGLTPEHLNSRLDEISNVFGIDREKAVKTAKRHTILLTYASGDLLARFNVLSHLLPIDKKRLMTVLQREPGLLTKSPTSVAGKLFRLADILHVSLQDAALVYAGQPGLLRLAEDRLKARWERLQLLAGRHQPWQHQLQTMPPQRLGRCLAVPETIVNRLAFLINKNMQALPVVQDLKRVLTCSTTHFKNTLLAARRTGMATAQAQAGPSTD